MAAQPSRSSPHPVEQSRQQDPQTKETSNIPALLGMVLASLGLLCVVVGAMRGANILLSLLVGVLDLRLLALCYSSFHALKSKLHLTQLVASQDTLTFVPNISAAPTTFAAAEAITYAPLSSHSIQNGAAGKHHTPHPQRGQYLQSETPPQPIAHGSDIPYIPIEQDEIFQLDLPTGDEYVLYLPKEGEALVECQDRFALNARWGRYAIADGVSGSFASGPWARIIARGYIEYALDVPIEMPEGKSVQDVERTDHYFGERIQFEQWLSQRRNMWYAWMSERWVPTMNALFERRGDNPVDWDIEIEHGAQTTLTGCWLRPRADLSDPYIDVYVSVIGDSEFFLFRRNEHGAWQNIAALPFISAAEFDARPTVLATKPQAELVERVWTHRQEGSIPALPGDRIVLATDTLAKWILTQVQHQEKAWTLLLDSTDSSLHEQMLRHELHANRMEDDDLTMIVIPISSSRRETH